MGLIMIVKTQIVVYMYDALINGEELCMDEILNEYNISVRTFRRYISEINSFLSNNYKNKTVTYDGFTNSYKLIDL